jgi:pimeloyl-ACP methyl ester carboxylesterase
VSETDGEVDWGNASILDRGGSLLHYWTVGPEDAPVVVLSHGATMDHHLFDKQLEPLLDAGYRVLGWDMRGHGLSKPIGVGFSLSTVVDDLVAILDEIGVEKVTAVGQSLGGYVSQELLFRYPERIDALVIIGATDVTRIPPRLENLALKLSPYLFKLWPYQHLKKTIAERTAETESAKRYAYCATSQLSKREFLTVWKSVPEALHSEPGYTIQRPFLLVHGENDRTGTVARDAPSWAKKEPNCRYEVIPDAGHNANDDNPQRFNEQMLDFLGTVQ